MRPLLLLLVLCVCLSDAFDTHKEVQYGSSHEIWLSRGAETVEFISQTSYTRVILWKRSDPQISEGSKFSVSGNYFVINGIFTRDSGLYEVRDKARTVLNSEYVDVMTVVSSYTLKDGESLSIEFNVDSKSCNIYFHSDSEHDTQLIRAGRVHDDIYTTLCKGLQYAKPCSLTHENPPKTCTGRFEVIDDEDDMAMVVTVQVGSPGMNVMYIGIGVFIGVVIIISCCVTRCFCRGSQSTKNKSKPAPDPAPDAHHSEYSREPAGRRQAPLREPSGARYTAQPSSASTGPLIHNPPTTNTPPVNSQVYPHGHQPVILYEPLCSDPEPRFELKGAKFNLTPPLSSDSTDCTVYTSDKLNFR